MAREARFVSTPNAPAPGVDVAACDREPIHIPGSIQPHGSLLVLSAESLTVLQVSENSATALGVEPAKLLGLHLVDVLGADHAQQLGPAMQALPAGEPAVLLASLTPPRAARRCHAIAHRVDQVLVLELEEIRPAGPAADLVSIAAGFSRSNRPLSMISLLMKITSRNTANTCSFMPRIISPSTNACPGAFLISSLMPQAWRTSSTSKSL
jgi:light-regulated signal transduction histidine kinase (bacteriophytochrome)